jgi:hypothetical protein
MNIPHVYLVPGFMGFTSLGTMSYFQGVSEVLTEALAARGCPARVIECSTVPTGSIRRRADRLLQQVLDSGGLEAQSLHFVGHSTGGLDVRLLLTPGVRLRLDDAEARVAARTRAAVCVSTPHHGTPLANFFLTAQGQRLLEAVTVLVTTPAARHSVYAIARALSLAARLDDWTGRADSLLDALSEKLLRDVTLSPRDPIWAYLVEMSSDQGVIVQLTPESMDLFDAAVPDREGVRYASVVTAAPPPPAGIRAGMLLRPEQLVLGLLFAAMYAVTSRIPRNYPIPLPGPGDQAALADALPRPATSRDSDGVVPVFSQLRGALLDVVSADHLDIVGQFPCDRSDRLCDWLPSGARFDRDRFVRTWTRIADFVAACASGAGASG